jgi:hypothetical protein
MRFIDPVVMLVQRLMAAPIEMLRQPYITG